MRSQLSIIAKRLKTALFAIEYESAQSHQSKCVSRIVGCLESVEDERADLLMRRLLIEKKKEIHEQELLDKVGC